MRTLSMAVLEMTTTSAKTRGRTPRPPPAPVPAELHPLCQRALAAFTAGRYAEALPVLGRLVLALPLDHSLRPAVRGMLARVYLDLGNFAAARRELASALATDPANPTLRELNGMLLQASGELDR